MISANDLQNPLVSLYLTNSLAQKIKLLENVQLAALEDTKQPTEINVTARSQE